MDSFFLALLTLGGLLSKISLGMMTTQDIRVIASGLTIVTTRSTITREMQIAIETHLDDRDLLHLLGSLKEKFTLHLRHFPKAWRFAIYS